MVFLSGLTWWEFKYSIQYQQGIQNQAHVVFAVFTGSDSDEEYDGGIGIWSIAWSPQGGQLIAGKQGATE